MGEERNQNDSFEGQNANLESPKEHKLSLEHTECMTQFFKDVTDIDARNKLEEHMPFYAFTLGVEDPTTGEQLKEFAMKAERKLNDGDYQQFLVRIVDEQFMMDLPEGEYRFRIMQPYLRVFKKVFMTEIIKDVHLKKKERAEQEDVQERSDEQSYDSGQDDHCTINSTPLIFPGREEKKLILPHTIKDLYDLEDLQEDK